MSYDIQLRLPHQWISETETFLDESGYEVTHFEATLNSKNPKESPMFIDVYAGDMPEGETAEDQAFANYAETVGFSEDDPEDFNPIEKIKFNGKSAWGFAALCEDDSPMRFLTQEVRKGLLAVIVFGAGNEARLNNLQDLVERNLRIK